MKLTQKATDFINQSVSTILDGSLEKKQLIDAFNGIFRELYYSGSVERFVKVSICKGVSRFKHEMSVSAFRSGLLFEVQNDDRLAKAELQDISFVIFGFPPMVRLLKSLGFDTLIIKGKRTGALFYKIDERITMLDNESPEPSDKYPQSPSTQPKASVAYHNHQINRPLPGKGVSQGVINLIAYIIIIAFILLVIFLIRLFK